MPDPAVQQQAPEAAAAAPVPEKKHPRTLSQVSADSLPCDLEAEKAVLSSILLDPANFNTVKQQLREISLHFRFL